MISSTSGAGLSNGCAGTCTSSTRPCRCRSVRSTGPSGSTGVGRKLARREQTTQVRIARDLVGRCRSLTRTITELDRELQSTDAEARAEAARSCPAAAP